MSDGVRRFQRSAAYRILTRALIAVILASALAPAGASAARSGPGLSRANAAISGSLGAVSAAQGRTAPLAAPAAGEEPDLAVPDVAPARRTVARTVYSKTDQLLDGSMAMEISARPLYWRDSSGELRPFDDTLHPVSGASAWAFENARGGNRVSFDRAADVAAGLPVVRAESEGASIRMTAVGAKPSTATATGSWIRYADAYPDADIEYQLDAEFLKEAVILRSAPRTRAQATFTYLLDVEGVTPRKGADGSVAFADSAGKEIFRMPRPFMFDANEANIEGRYSDEIAVTLTELAAGKYRLEYAPDLAWLQSPERQLPITIDPSIEWVVYSRSGASAQNANIFEASPGRNDPGLDLGYNRLIVGKRPTDSLRRDTLIQFPELDTVPADSAIVSAQLHLEAEGGAAGMPMQVHVNEGPWDDETVTWSTAPPYRAGYNARRTSVAPGRNSFDLSRAVRWWVRGDLPNDGVRILSTGAAGDNVYFASSYTTNGAEWRPKLEVAYVPATRYGQDGLWSYAQHDHGGGNSSMVNTTTGNLVFTHAGPAIAARGFGVDLTHTYNSQDPYGQTDYFDSEGAWYGEGWQFSQNIRLLEIGEGAVVFKDGSGGANRVFAREADNAATSTRTYYTPLFYGATLTKDLSATPADPRKVYTLRPEASGISMYFDGGGKLREVADRNGNSLRYAYDTDGTSLADPNGKVTTITDVANRKTLLEYGGPGGRLSKVADMAGRVSAYGYSAGGNLLTIRHGVQADGTALQTTTFTYRDDRHLAAVKNPRGYTSTIAYAERHGWEDAAAGADGWAAVGASAVSRSTTEAWRGAGGLRIDLSSASETAPGGARITHAVSFPYNATQQALQGFVWLPAGARLDARWVLRDSRGVDRYGPTLPVSGGSAGLWTAVRVQNANVDPNHKVKALTLELSARAGDPAYTGTVYLDQVMVRGVAQSLTDNRGAEALRLGYDWSAKKTTEGRPNASGVFQDTTYTYDRFGLTTRVEEPGAHSASTATYDADLRTQSATSEGATTDPEYYAGSNQVRTVSGTGTGTTTSGVDTDTGEPRYAIDERNTRRRADGLDFVATVYATDASGNVTSVSTKRYGANADLDSGTVRACVTTGAPTATCGVALRETKYGYGAGGLMTSMTDPNGNVTTYGYQTATGYLTRIETPAGTGEAGGRVTAIAVNADGGPSRRTDPKGQATEYAYDGLGRETEVRYGVVNGVAQSSVARVLDAHGNPTRVTDASGVTAYAYDANDQPTSESRTQNGITRTATYAYHANGQVRSMAPMGGGTVTYGYDAAGELVSQTDPNDGGRAVLFAHDHHARTATVTFPSGVSRTESYDVAGRITGITLKDAAGSVLRSYAYDYGLDAQGNPTGQYREGYTLTTTEQDGTAVSYGYDELGRLVSAQRTGTHPYTQSISYDANDNRLSITTNGVTTTARYDGANQLVSQGSVSYAYDRNGNLTGYSGNALTYDARNHWTGGTVGGKAVGFGYDGVGRRVSRTVDGARTDYWYDAAGMGLETGAAGASYTRGPGGDLISRASGSSVVNYGTDRLGSVTALLDGQTVTASYAYDPWGEEIGSSGTAYNPYRYTGTYLDEATGLYQMGARYYAPETGRFTQLDPLPCTIDDGQRYAYAGGNPANFIDPSGTTHQMACGWYRSVYKWRTWGTVWPKVVACAALCGAALFKGTARLGTGGQGATRVPGGLSCGEICKRRYTGWNTHTYWEWRYGCYYPGQPGYRFV